MTDANFNQANIVIIDDEPEICRGYLDELKWIYHYTNIDIFTDPREAVKHVTDHKNAIDIILLDLQMPHIDGIEMVQKISNINPHIKIIILSGFSDLDSVKEELSVIKNDEILNTIQNKPVQDFSIIDELIKQAFVQKRATNNAKTI